MLKQNYRVVGVMSGTSLDGVDLALVDFDFKKTLSFSIQKAITIPYSSNWKSKLESLTTLSMSALKQVDMEYTILLSDIVSQFINDNDILNVDAVCSHGHTALHQPERKFTYQMGNLPEFSRRLNLMVVCDYRTQDVELGGQGAPLVPIGDRLLFSEYEFCLNLGGFANVSTEMNGKRIAYDICPVNIVLNHYVRKQGLEYDDNGALAKSGSINVKLLEALNAEGFYEKQHPKSLGLEWVNSNIFPLIDSFRMDVKDILRTFVEHISIQISKQFQIKDNSKVLVTGGGAYNLFLMERIKMLTIQTIIIPDDKLVEYKEALIFGLLGVLKLRNEINCLSSVTGASSDHSSGRVFRP